MKGDSRGKPIYTDFSDLDLACWKEHTDIITDSLWLIPERDSTGVHTAEYHGNFVPQIPYQLLRRFTKKGDVVLDPFLGLGTTLIEAARLGRHAIGVELKPDLCRRAEELIAKTENPDNVSLSVICANSRSKEARAKAESHLNKLGRDRVELIILHPPYHDIIKFSEREEDLSNAPAVPDFCSWFSEVVDNFKELLRPGRFMAVVIGDKYEKGELVPLSFMLMEEVRKRGFILKSIIVKDIQGNRAKRNLDNLWRYRALKGGFYIFKHEYIVLFYKPKDEQP